MSPREFDGAVAREVHEHFDAAGKLTGTTVVTRESMWDDDARGRALRLAEYEADLCPCGCGLPRETAQSPAAMGVGKFTCYASRAIAVQKRRDQHDHKAEKDPRDRDGKPAARWDDGLNYYVVPQQD